jgi:hypothetical protein
MEKIDIEKIVNVYKMAMNIQQYLKKASCEVDNMIIKNFLEKYSYQKNAFAVKLDCEMINLGFEIRIGHIFPEEINAPDEDKSCKKSKIILEWCQKKDYALLELCNDLLRNNKINEHIKEVIENQQVHLRSGINKIGQLCHNLEKSDLD